jgi:hypothetical protein
VASSEWQRLSGKNKVVLDPELVDRLEDRVGLFHLSQRVLRETETYPDLFRHHELEEILPIAAILEFGLRLFRLWGRGRSNATQFELTENTVGIDKLPSAFEGFRILQLSDLHFSDESDALTGLLAMLEDVSYDLCVLTGDYNAGFTETPGLKSKMVQLQQSIRTETLAILGNHDSISMVPWMEDLGVRFLINESHQIEKSGETITIAGVDDYHRFRLSNLEKALSGIASSGIASSDIESEVIVLLNHSPEQYRQAAYAGVDLYLAGHTHGGQICLPNGFAPKLNIECGRQVGKGSWRFRDMQGYTSRGVGVSLVPVRFNCPPEVVIHVLEKNDEKNNN